MIIRLGRNIKLTMLATATLAILVVVSVWLQPALPTRNQWIIHWLMRGSLAMCMAGSAAISWSTQDATKNWAIRATKSFATAILVTGVMLGIFLAIAVEVRGS